MAGAQERKLAAIMFTDIVASCALTHRSEADALEVLGEHECLLRELFVEHAGREVKNLGDGFLVEFASVLEAARCAIAIQRALHERNATVPAEYGIQIRIGIHLGDVVHRGDDVFGDGVNIAARIEPLAEPGGICISQQVMDQIRDRIDAPIVRLGRRELKNIPTPVILYKIVPPWERRRGPFADPRSLTIRGKGARLFVVPLVITVALAAPYLWQGADTQRAGTPRTISRSMQRGSVLPFRNISTDPKDEYFAAGMTEALGTDLSKIRSVQVVSPDSVEEYRKAGKAAPAIGRELGAGAVVVGSVQRSADQLRVNVQLIDVASGDQLWGDRFDQKTQNLFAVQDRISEKVASALRACEESRAGLRPAASGRARVAARGTTMLRGRSSCRSSAAPLSLGLGPQRDFLHTLSSLQ